MFLAVLLLMPFASATTLTETVHELLPEGDPGLPEPEVPGTPEVPDPQPVVEEAVGVLVDLVNDAPDWNETVQLILDLFGDQVGIEDLVPTAARSFCADFSVTNRLALPYVSLSGGISIHIPGYGKSDGMTGFGYWFIYVGQQTQCPSDLVAWDELFS